MTPYKEFTKSVKIKNKSVEVLVRIYVEEDNDTQIEGDISFDDKAEERAYIKRFRSGELFMACVTVTAQALDETGSDSLGACHIHSNNAFNSKPFDTDVDAIVVDHDMVENAIKELIDTIQTRAKTLRDFA